MINLFIETNIGANDSAVALEIEATDCEYNGWQFEVVQFEGCTKQEACQWVRENQSKLLKKVNEKIRENRDEAVLAAADID